MSFSLATYWRELANGNRRGLVDRLLLGLLVPFSVPYALIQVLRALLYRSGILTSRSLPRPVISIGNITVGGTGKTPVTLFIARLLLSRGLRVVVLSRGYGGTLEGKTAVVSDGTTILLSADEAGDEPFLMATALPGLGVVIGSDRHAAGMLAMEGLAPDLFLLDDGFQHLRLKRDLNILLMDARTPLGNGFCLPAGLLREPPAAARRADLIIHTRCKEVIDTIPGLEHIPQISARHELVDATPLAGGAPLPLETISGRRIVAFAGIADPKNFFEGLVCSGIPPVETVSFPDHIRYTSDVIERLADAKKRHSADCLLTTEKDGVKLSRLPSSLIETIWLVRLSLKISRLDILDENLRKLLQK